MLPGRVPVTVSNLVARLTDGFPLQGRPNDQALFLRRALGSLGTSLNYKVSPMRTLGGSSLDLTWWEPGRGTILAADCEWGAAGDVAAAFTRLMTIKAAIKLLIFSTRQAGAERPDVLLRTDHDAVMMAIGAALLDFAQHVEGEYYVLLERSDQKPAFRSYEFCVPANGKLALGFQEAANVFRPIEAVLATV